MNSIRTGNHFWSLAIGLAVLFTIFIFDPEVHAQESSEPLLDQLIQQEVIGREIRSPEDPSAAKDLGSCLPQHKPGQVCAVGLCAACPLAYRVIYTCSNERRCVATGATECRVCGPK